MKLQILFLYFTALTCLKVDAQKPNQLTPSSFILNSMDPNHTSMIVSIQDPKTKSIKIIADSLLGTYSIIGDKKYYKASMLNDSILEYFEYPTRSNGTIFNDKIYLSHDDNFEVANLEKFDGFKFIDHYPILMLKDNKYLGRKGNETRLGIYEADSENLVFDFDFSLNELEQIIYEKGSNSLGLIKNGLTHIDLKSEQVNLFEGSTSKKDYANAITALLLSSSLTALIAPLGYYAIIIPYGSNKTFGIHSNLAREEGKMYWFGGNLGYAYNIYEKSMIWQKKVSIDELGANSLLINNEHLFQINLGFVIKNGKKVIGSLPTFRKYLKEDGQLLTQFKLSKDKSEYLVDYQLLNDSTMLAFFNTKIALVNTNSSDVKVIKSFDKIKDGNLEGRIDKPFFLKHKENKNTEYLEHIKPSPDSIIIATTNTLYVINKTNTRGNLRKYDEIYNILDVQPNHYVLQDDKHLIILNKEGKKIFHINSAKYLGIHFNKFYFSSGELLYSFPLDALN